MSDPSAASTLVFPAGVRSVSSGSASSREAELRAARAGPPTHGKSTPASSAPARTMVPASLAIRAARFCEFSNIAGKSTWRMAFEPPRSGTARGQDSCFRRAGGGVVVRAGQFYPHHPQAVEVVDVAGGGRHGPDGDLRVGAAEPIGQPLLPGRLGQP